MHDRRYPKIVSFTAAVAALVASVTSFSSFAHAAGAAPVVPGQGGSGPRVCIEPGIRFGESPNTPSVEIRQIPGGLPAGRYQVSVTTSDAYLGRSQTPFEIETSERVTLYGHITVDLADGVESDTKTLVFEVSFQDPQTVVEVAHTPANGHPDSVRVDQVCWERLDDPGSSTTVPVATATTTPSPVGQTTPTFAFLQAGTTTTSGSTDTTTTVTVTGRLPLSPAPSAVVSRPAYTG
jgi:hypothetical protein